MAAASAQQQPQSDAQAEQRTLVEFACKAAETFVAAYYAAADAPGRGSLIPTLYLPDSTIVWNGTPVSGRAGMAQLLAVMPGSKHELQAFDAHPLGGHARNGGKQAPSMLLTVNGIVTHHTPGSSSVVSGASAPSSNAPRSAKEAHAEQVPYEALPRAFSQSFVLISDLQRDGGIAAVEADMHARYFVQADQFRFVG